MKRNTLLAFVISWCIIILLMAIIIFRKPSETLDHSSYERLLEDSISRLKKEHYQSQIRQQALQRGYDSLLALDPLVINRTRDKVHFILTDATPDELDSCIRTNWKTHSRYR